MFQSLRWVQILLIFTWLLIPIGAVYITILVDQSNTRLKIQALELATAFTFKAQVVYSENVINRLNNIHPVKSSTDYALHPDTLPTPATFAIEVSEAASTDDITVRMFSERPFKQRKNTAIPRNAIEKEALDRLIAGDENYIYSDRERFIYAAPVIMVDQSCVDCHNNHPDSSYKQWKVGDMRSAIMGEIKIQRSSVSYLWVIMLVVLLIAIATPIILLQKLSSIDFFKKQSITDNLTGAYNRQFIDKELKLRFNEHINKTQGGRVLSIMLLDFDHFKEVNDTYGHIIGDQCLKESVLRLQAILQRESDVIARYGGEEFLIFTVSSSHNQSIKMANRLRAAISELPISEECLSITCSIGICHIDIDSVDANFDDAIKIADKALYTAKNSGRDQIIVYPYSGQTSIL